MNKKEKQFNPALWNPVGVKKVSIPQTPRISDGHQGFVEYQRPDERYEVRGIMPKAPRLQKHDDYDYVGKTGDE